MQMCCRLKKPRPTLAVLAIVMTFSSARGANNPNEAKRPPSGGAPIHTARQIDAANGMLNRGLYDLAETEYRAVLSADADEETTNSARYGLGICLYRLDRHAEVVEALAPLAHLKQFAYDAEVGVMRGQSQLALQRYEEAAQTFQTVAKNHTDHELSSSAIVGAVEALYRSGANKEAIQFALGHKQHLAKGPMRDRATLFQAAAMMNLQDAKGATELLQALRERESSPELLEQVRMMLGQCALQSNDNNTAVKWFNEIIESASPVMHSEALLGLANALYGLGNTKAANEAVQRVLDSMPNETLRANALMLSGRIRFDLGAFAEAREAFEAVRRIDTANQAEADYWIAKCALRLGSAREAVELFEQWHKAHAGVAMTPEATYDRAVALIESDRPDEATVILSAFCEQFPKHALAPSALHLLAVTAHRTGDDALCEERCEAYVEAYPDSPEVADVIVLAGRCAIRSETWQRAIQWHSLFASRFPGDPRLPEAYFHAGFAYYRLEDFDEAERFFSKLLVDGQMPEPFAIASLALGDIRFQAADWKAADRWLSDYLKTDAQPESGDEALLKRGMARRRLSDLPRALADFDALLERWPKSDHRARALLERGEVLTLQGDRKAATVAFEKASQETGSQAVSTQASFQQAVLSMQVGQYEEAATHLTTFLETETDPLRRGEAFYQRGQCMLAVGAFAKAVADFSAVSAESKAHDRASESIAWRFVALVRQDKLDDALALWSQLTPAILDRLDSKTRTNVLSERAWALRATGGATEAATAYAVILKQPDLDAAAKAQAMLGLAEIEIERDGCAAGLKRLRELLDAAPPGSEVPASVRERVLYRLGLCAVESEQWEEAQGHLSKLIGEFPDNAASSSIRLYLGEALLQLGRSGEARGHLEFVTGACGDPKLCAAALLRLGECLAAQQHWAQSERVLQDYLTRYGESDVWYQAQFGLAWAREHQDRHDDAIEAYREVVERHRGPSAARAQFQIGECLFAKGEHEAAVREFLKVDILYDYPQWSAAALYETGRCFELLDRRVEARSHLQTVIDRFGDTKWASLAANRIPKLTASVVPGH